MTRGLRKFGRFGRLRRYTSSVLRSVPIFGFLVFLSFLPEASAAGPLTYRYAHHIFTVGAREVGSWQSPGEEWTYHGRPYLPVSALRVDGDAIPPLPNGVVRTVVLMWNREAIKASLSARISAVLDREPGTVTIRGSTSDDITFDGVGFPGRSVDLDALALLTEEALRTNVVDIMIPVHETQPTVTVEDPTLRAAGVRELVAFGESNFAGSPVNRRHNIAVGLRRFDGHRIARGEMFSFVDVLGPVDGSTGYRRELVIKGDRTEPDYGGGLCQVSTTAYRGVWEYGFPITERKNHSYAVRYYGPYGTDATTYLPRPDMRFTNDSPGDLVIQTHIEGDDAYFLYYGTKDARETDVIGPYIWGMTKAPPLRTEYTLDLPPGEKRVLGHAVPGLRAAWYRIVRRDGTEDIEAYISIYEARPDFVQIGVESLPTGSGATTETPAI